MIEEPSSAAADNPEISPDKRDPVTVAKELLNLVKALKAENEELKAKLAQERNARINAELNPNLFRAARYRRDAMEGKRPPYAQIPPAPTKSADQELALKLANEEFPSGWDNLPRRDVRKRVGDRFREVTVRDISRDTLDRALGFRKD